MKELPSSMQLDKYYKSNFHYQDGALNEKVIRKQSRQILNKLSKYFPNGKTICDVGSGYGFFLDESKKLGYDVFGIEPSKILAKSAVKKFSVSVFLGTLTEYYKVTSKQYDIVTCIHVIEHVRNPRQFIKSMLQLVKPGGLLYLETPNSDSHLLYIERDDYTFLIPPDHLWLLSKDSIDRLLPKEYYIERTRTYSYSEHFMGIIKKIIGKKPIKGKLFKNNTPSKPVQIGLENRVESLRKRMSHLVFDTLLAPLFTSLLNLNHKGSILELYIRKKA